MYEKSVEDDYFDRWGVEGDQAFAILCDECEFVPSLEVFEYGLEIARARTQFPVPVQRYARIVADAYMQLS